VPRLEVDIEMTRTPRHLEVCVVRVAGILSTPTLQEFRAGLREVVDRKRDVILSLEGVSYVNSSGLAEIVRLSDDLQQQNVLLILVELDREVRRLLQMLGLHNVLHVFDTVEEATEFLDSDVRSAPAAQRAEPETAQQIRRGVFVPQVAPPPPLLPNARVVLAVGGDVHFPRFLTLSLTGMEGSTHLVRTPDEARTAMAEGKCDLVFVDTTLPEAGRLVADFKTTLSNGLHSVIEIRPRDYEPSPKTACRVRQDEFLVEPFEVREAVVLAESEFARCDEQSMLIEQEATLEIGMKDDAVSEANDLLEAMLSAAGLETDVSESFYYGVREAIDNARRHGNRNDPNKVVTVEYILDREKVTVTVTDEGPGFDFRAALREATDRSPVEQVRARAAADIEGGLGIGLMLRCCDRVEYSAPGNSLRLTKYR
jgi:anti-anti-sigma factor